MNTTIALGLSSLMLLTAFTVNSRTAAESRPAFSAEVAGDVTAHPTGEARFGVTGGVDQVPAVFTISLGATGEEGSILFTRHGGEPLGPGLYRISDHADERDEVRALVMTGSATRPTGVFQGKEGLLVITSTTRRELRGTFRIEAEGFLAAQPELEDRPVRVAGSFTAGR